ncbi:2-methylcitrate dehydratase PrpD [Meredithblackwellia eburnea MCA 4105]
MSKFSPTHFEDAAVQLAKVAATTTYNDLSPAAITVAKWAILDTLGCCIGATGGSPNYLEPIRKYLKATATTSDKDVPLPTLGLRMPSLDATLWLGALAHTLDFDDVAGYSHPSGPAVSAALPVAYAEKVDGRRLIAAVALGQDMVIRLAQALKMPLSHYGWLPSMPGTIGAAITTGSLLGLDAASIQSAMGLALHQTSGTMQALAQPGSAYPAIREGINARAGVLSAFLAREGLPGDNDSLEGQYGFFNLFFQGDYDPEFIRGKQLLGPITTFKLWPCAGHPQLFLTALLELIEKKEIDADHIAHIRLTGCSDLLPHQCVPIEVRAAPKNSIDAKVSIPFLVGKLIRHGNITIQHFTPEGMADAPAVEIAKKVTHSMDASLVRGANGYGVGIVEVEHNDGRIARAQTEYPLGHPSNPATWDQIVAKFHKCLEVSATHLPVQSANAIVKAVEDLENLSDTRVLLDLLFDNERAKV